jgi:hypothetical protein
LAAAALPVPTTEPQSDTRTNSCKIKCPCQLRCLQPLGQRTASAQGINHADVQGKPMEFKFVEENPRKLPLWGKMGGPQYRQRLLD